MGRICRSWFLGTVSLVIVLVFAAGCYREVAEEVAPTPGAGEEQGTPSDEQVIATALAEATSAATAQIAEEPTLLVPTLPPPTAVPEEAVEEPSPVPQPTAVPTQPAPTSPPPPPPTAEVGSGVHVVQAGENLFRIGLRYGTTVDALMAANNLTSQTIYVGQKLVIPGSGAQPEPPASGATTYVVKAGDNLYRIALSFGLSYQQLAQYNGITDPNSIYAGQVLRIPPR